MKKEMDFRYGDYLFIALILLSSFWFQTHVYLNWDASWHLEAAKRIVQGGASYSKNLFDDNLPMVYWYFIPTILLQHLTGFFIVTLAIISIHFSVLLSFLLSNVYLKEIDEKAKYWQIEIIRYGLLVSLLFFPGMEFGQRDMMVTVFVFPYIVLMGARITRRLDLEFNNLFFQILLGLLASIGIAMNPFYGLIILILELQLWFSVKKIVLWRPEIITFVMTYLIYLVVIGLVYPDYYTQIIPSFFVFCSDFNVTSFRDLFQASLLWYGLSTIPLFFISQSKVIRRDWLRTLLLCVIASIVVYLINGKLYLSHVIFLVVCTNVFYLAMLCEILVSLKNKNWPINVFIFYLLLFSCINAYAINAQCLQWAMNPKSIINQVVSFFQQEKPKSKILILAMQEFPMQSMVFYSTLDNISPWSGCVTIPEIAKSQEQIDKLIPWKKNWVMRYKKIFIHQVTSLLQSQKPSFVFIAKEDDSDVMKFDYVDFLSQSAAFRKAWGHYHLVKTISQYQIYKYKKDIMRAQTETQ